MKRFITLFATLVLVAFVPSAVAASGSLFGGATMSGNQVKLVADVSDTSTTNDSSGINFTSTGVTTFSSLTQLATKFNVTDDGCGAGSPRFQINFGSQNAFVYLGPSPTFTGCTPHTLVDSGNLIGNNDAALPAHMKHPGDIIPAPASGCPTHVVLVKNHKIFKAKKHKRSGR
jgi:hypothetical protein